MQLPAAVSAAPTNGFCRTEKRFSGSKHSAHGSLCSRLRPERLHSPEITTALLQQGSSRGCRYHFSLPEHTNRCQLRTSKATAIYSMNYILGIFEEK